jgi:hypothetical protein
MFLNSCAFMMAPYSTPPMETAVAYARHIKNGRLTNYAVEANKRTDTKLRARMICALGYGIAHRADCSLAARSALAAVGGVRLA